MATRKKARAKAVSTQPKKNSPPKKKVARKATASSRPKRAAARAPETLRLKSATPSFTVSDLVKSLVFYTEALGFVVGEKWTDGDILRGVMLKAGACELGLSQDDGKLGRDRKKGVGFRVWFDTAQTVDAIAGRLKATGYVLTEEPADHPAWGVRSFSVDDPDGFHITIARSL